MSDFKHRLQARRELLQHYKSVFGNFWKLRSSLDGGIFNEQEAPFLPAALALQEAPVSRSARLTARLLMAMVCATLAWSYFGKLDISVNAGGKVIASGHSKTIASVEVAAVRRLYVQEGQAVKAGDVLIELDSSMLDAEHDKAVGSALEARIQMARASAMVDAIDHSSAPRLASTDAVSSVQWQAAQRELDAQYRDMHAQLTRIDSEIARYAKEAPLAAQRAADYKALAQNQDVASHSWLEKELASIELGAQLADAKNQRFVLLAKARRDAHNVLTEGRRVAQASEQDARSYAAHSRLRRLLAPVDGTVQQLTVHAIGAVVPAAQPLMMIVPREHKVEVEAILENRDIGFVHEGQQVQVKLEAFDYTKYGTVSGHVSHISRDAIADEKKGLTYAIKIAIDQSTILIEDKRVPLTPGMSVNTEIKTGTRRVIEYVLSPLMVHQREALHER